MNIITVKLSLKLIDRPIIDKKGKENRELNFVIIINISIKDIFILN